MTRTPSSKEASSVDVAAPIVDPAPSLVDTGKVDIQSDKTGGSSQLIRWTER